jgi:hypothetical protein
MGFWPRVTLTLACLIATAPAVCAKQTLRAGAQPARQNPVANVHAPLQIQTGQRQQAAGQPFKGLQLQVTPRRSGNAATPAPLPTPEFNPLKRRRMAMPGSLEPDLAF